MSTESTPEWAHCIVKRIGRTQKEKVETMQLANLVTL
jgi:hypothetical protein